MLRIFSLKSPGLGFDVDFSLAFFALHFCLVFNPRGPLLLRACFLKERC